MSVIKLDKYLNSFFKLKLQDADKELYNSIRDEFIRQQNHRINCIRKYCIQSSFRSSSSVLTNKYAEGYPSKRYYGGCEHVDVSENLAIEELKNFSIVNLQMYNRTQALKLMVLFI